MAFKPQSHRSVGGYKMNAVPHPHAMLPGRFGSLVREATYATQAPIELVTAVALAAASVAVQNTCTVERKTGLEGPVSLFLLTICDSGERKSAVQALFFKRFAELQRRWREEGEKKASYHLVDHQLWQEKVAVLRSEMKRSTRRDEPVDGIERRLRAALESEPKLDNARKLVYEDTTPEALLAGLHECGKSAALVHDEFGHFIDGSMSKKLPLLNSLWSGMDTSVDRKTGKSFVISDARLTCLFQAQPAVFDRFMGKQGQQARGNGFLARTLLAFPPSTQGTRFDSGQQIYCHDLDWFYERCGELLEKNERRVLRLAPDAKRHWQEIANIYEENIRPGRCNSDIRDFASKAAENIARIAAVLHGFMIDYSDEISLEILNASINLVEWYRQQYVMLMPIEDSISELQKDLDCLYDWIQSVFQRTGCRHLECSYILKYGPNRLRERGRMNYLIDWLANNNQIWIALFGRKRVLWPL